MSNLISKIGLVFLTMILVLFLVFYSFKNARSDNTVEGMQETLKISLAASNDCSARVKTGYFRLNKTKFEKKFRTNIVKNKSLNIPAKDYHFTYLPAKHEPKAIRGVKVRFKLSGKWYQGTYVINQKG